MDKEGDVAGQSAGVDRMAEPADVYGAMQTVLEQNYLSNDVLALIVATIAMLSAIFFACLQLYQQRIFALERNIDILQRLNETALSSPENLKAAFTSVRDDGQYRPEEAREVYFHFLRLNRLYRAWLLRKAWALRRRDYDLVMDNYAGMLKKAEPMLGELRHRGYPEAFIADLKTAVANASLPPLIVLGPSDPATGDTAPDDPPFQDDTPSRPLATR